jgi:hypothetical protein
MAKQLRRMQQPVRSSPLELPVLESQESDLALDRGHAKRVRHRHDRPHVEEDSDGKKRENLT